MGCRMHYQKNFVQTIAVMALLFLAASQVLLRATGGKPVPSASFSTAADYTVGTLPFANAVGDFNGDHIPDIAVVNYNSNDVSVLFGNGDGTFQPAVTYAVGTEPSAITAVDLNNDGVPDLAVADEIGRTVAVLINKADGTGTFKTPVLYPAEQAPRGIVAGDLRGIGIQDLVVANNLSNDVSVFLGNGDGTFKPYVSYASHTHPKSVAVGYFTSDNHLDIACANHDSADVSILIGNGDGTFQAPVNYPVGLEPRHVMVADFNKDGKADLVTANGGASTISVLYGNGDGTFQPQVVYTASLSPRFLVVEDYNGDGFLDVATSNYGASNVSVLLGTGSSTAGSQFLPAINFPVGKNPTGIASGDFNRDGKPDIAVNVGGSPITPNKLEAVLLNTPVVLTPNTLTFPTKAVGTHSNPRQVILNNTSPNSLTISNITITGTNPGDFSQTNDCGSGLSGNSRCTIQVTFQPTNINVRLANVVVTDSAVGGSQTLTLVGTGTAVTLSPPNLAFAPQIVGTTSPAQTVTLTNVSATALTITGIAITGTNSADFVQTNTCGAGIAARAKCTINLTFHPTATGTRTAAVSVTDNGGGSPQSVPLTGTGQ
jgi:FG-GAP-like repeat/Abnormal spindle-like microcephaly-assoc'd, ASPM-SPD-2-Hydin